MTDIAAQLADETESTVPLDDNIDTLDVLGIASRETREVEAGVVALACTLPIPAQHSVRNGS